MVVALRNIWEIAHRVKCLIGPFIREVVMSGDMRHLCITHRQGLLSKSRCWEGALVVSREFKFALEITLGKNIELAVELCDFWRNGILN